MRRLHSLRRSINLSVCWRTALHQHAAGRHHRAANRCVSSLSFLLLAVLEVRGSRLHSRGDASITRQASLTALTQLIFFRNGLGGNLPNLSPLTNLRELVIEDNNVRATLPGAISSLIQRGELTTLHFTDSPRISGSIGRELLAVRDTLTSLSIGRSGIRPGQMPAEFFQLTKLRVLNLADLEMTGTIPGTLAQMTDLRQLLLFGNRLTGRVPASLSERGGIRYEACALGGQWTLQGAALRNTSPLSTNCFVAGTCPIDCTCGDAGTCQAAPTPIPPQMTTSDVLLPPDSDPIPVDGSTRPGGTRPDVTRPSATVDKASVSIDGSDRNTAPGGVVVVRTMTTASMDEMGNESAPGVDLGLVLGVVFTLLVMMLLLVVVVVFFMRGRKAKREQRKLESRRQYGSSSTDSAGGDYIGMKRLPSGTVDVAEVRSMDQNSAVMGESSHYTSVCLRGRGSKCA